MNSAKGAKFQEKNIGDLRFMIQNLKDTHALLLSGFFILCLALSICFKASIFYPLPILYVLFFVVTIFVIYKNSADYLKMGLFDARFIFWLMLSGFTGLILINPFFSTYPFQSLTDIASYLILPFACFLGSVLFSGNKNNVLSFVFTLVSVSLLLTLIAIWQFFVFVDADFISTNYQPTALFMNPNVLAGALAMIFIPFSVLTWTQAKKSYFLLFTIISGVIFWGILTSKAATILSLSLICLILCIAFLYKDLKHNWRQILTFTVFLFAIYALSEVLGHSYVEAQSDRKVDKRLDIYQAVWPYIKETPLFGYGLGTFFHLYQMVRTEFQTGGVMAHSNIIDFVLETGPLMAIFFYGLMISVAIMTFRAWRSDTLARTDRVLLVGLFFGSLCVAGHSHISGPYHAPYILFIQGMFLSVIYSLCRPALAETRYVQFTLKLNKHLLCGVSVMVFAYLFYAILLSPLHSHMISEAKRLSSKAQYKQAFQVLNKASVLGMGLNDDIYITSAEIHNDILKAKDLSAQEQKEIIQNVLNNLEKAKKLNAYNFKVPFYMALYIKRGHLEADVSSGLTFENKLLETLKLNPFFLQARLILADYYKSKGLLNKEQDIIYQAFPFMHMFGISDQAKQYALRLLKIARESDDLSLLSEVQERLAQFEGNADKTLSYFVNRDCIHAFCKPWTLGQGKYFTYMNN